MQVDPTAAKEARVAAASLAADARTDAAAYSANQYGLARDQRVEEAQASAAARPTVSEKRASQPAAHPDVDLSNRPRPSSGSRILDVLA